MQQLGLVVGHPTFCNFTPRVHHKQSQKIKNHKIFLGGMPPGPPNQARYAVFSHLLEPPFLKFQIRLCGELQKRTAECIHVVQSICQRCSIYRMPIGLFQDPYGEGKKKIKSVAWIKNLSVCIYPPQPKRSYSLILLIYVLYLLSLCLISLFLLVVYASDTKIKI